MEQLNRVILLTGLCLGLGAPSLGCGGQAAAPGASGPEESSSTGDEAAVPNSVVRKSGSGKVIALMGPPGGQLELSEGPRVEVPSGAIEDGLEVTLTIAGRTSAFSNRESEKAVGPTFSVSPELSAPDGRPIVVSMPMAQFPEGWGQPALAYEYEEGGSTSFGEDSVHTKWQYEPAKLSGGRLMVEVSSLTGMRLQFVLTNLNAQ